MKNLIPAFTRSVLSVLLFGSLAVAPQAKATPVSDCTGQCANANTYLTADMVNRIIAQAYNEAKVQGIKAVTIAVVDRVGNVLGVFESAGAQNQAQSQGLPSSLGGLVTINSGRFNDRRPEFLSLNALLATPIPTNPLFQTGVGGKIPPYRNQGAGLENVQVPSSVAAIAKAITGAYLRVKATPSRASPLPRSSRSISIRESPISQRVRFLVFSSVNYRVVTS